MIKRILNIEKNIIQGKTLLLLGPRRVGKTTIVKNYLQTTNKKYIEFLGDTFETKNLFSDNSLLKITDAIKNYDLIFIDEAQEIDNIGTSLKIINDKFSKKSIIATGSSSFELNNQMGEPLVGRSVNKFLFPLSIIELLNNAGNVNNFEFDKLKSKILIYGMYPESILTKTNAESELFLNNMINNLLLKDILIFQNIKSSNLLIKLLQLIAFQIGKEISIDELATQLGIAKNTVDRYLDLLEKAYIIFRLNSFSRNKRKEISKKPKYYFYDLGIRNAIIKNFNLLNLRNDTGELWENFAIVERMKQREYRNIFVNQYFWRTYNGQEIDLIEEKNNKLFATEFKWNTNKKIINVPSEWRKYYGSKTQFQVVDQNNFLKWLISFNHI